MIRPMIDRCVSLRLFFLQQGGDHPDVADRLGYHHHAQHRLPFCVEDDGHVTQETDCHQDGKEVFLTGKDQIKDGDHADHEEGDIADDAHLLIACVEPAVLRKQAEQDADDA